MTPTPIIKINNVSFKREDLNPTGSAKDRAISLQVANAVKSGYQSAVISSTGNAAISALFYCQQHNLKLSIFLSTKVDKNKLSLIRSKTEDIHLSQKPISDAFKFAKNNNSYLLRQSTDPIALIGYSEIAREILLEHPQVSSIFIPVGSGTTLLGISTQLPDRIKIFAVQPASSCPIASFFDRDFSPENESITDALTVKLIPLKDKVIETINTHSGSGLVIQNLNVIKAVSYLKDSEISTSPEGALAYAGYQKALNKGLDVGANPLIVLTGAKR